MRIFLDDVLARFGRLLRGVNDLGLLIWRMHPAGLQSSDMDAMALIGQVSNRSQLLDVITRLEHMQTTDRNNIAKI
jgi:hypothetical protein